MRGEHAANHVNSIKNEPPQKKASGPSVPRPIYLYRNKIKWARATWGRAKWARAKGQSWMGCGPGPVARCPSYRDAVALS